MAKFHGFWPFFQKSRPPPGKTNKTLLIIGISRGFFGVFSESFWIFGVFGVPVIKEEKAIALRAIDILVFWCGCAMQWTQVFKVCWLGKMTIFGVFWGSKIDENEGFFDGLACPKQGHLAGIYRVLEERGLKTKSMSE